MGGRRRVHTAISYSISFAAHSRRAWKLWEGHRSRRLRILSSKWSLVSCGSIATTPYLSRTVRSKSRIKTFNNSRLFEAVPSTVIRAIMYVASLPFVVKERCLGCWFRFRMSAVTTRPLQWGRQATLMGIMSSFKVYRSHACKQSNRPILCMLPQPPSATLTVLYTTIQTSISLQHGYSMPHEYTCG